MNLFSSCGEKKKKQPQNSPFKKAKSLQMSTSKITITDIRLTMVSPTFFQTLPQVLST